MKIITSPVKKFGGEVALSDPMNMLQVLTWERAVRAIGELPAPVYVSDVNSVYLPAIIACVEKWQLDGVPNPPTPETFPATPRLASAKLFEWLVLEISKVYAGEEDTEGEKNA